MHVKEFQDQVVGHLKSIVDEGVSVLIVQNIGADHALNDPKLAFIIMNSVKVMKNAATELSIRTLDNPNACNKRPSSFQHSADKSNVEAANQVRIFHYSVPFTMTGRSHAKSIDEQWMRSTILTVKEPFPYIMTRQLVQSREIRTYSPIEVAIYDIEERIEAMESELEKVVRNLSDCNNLMRIVQGTVMPQVTLHDISAQPSLSILPLKYSDCCFSGHGLLVAFPSYFVFDYCVPLLSGECWRGRGGQGLPQPAQRRQREGRTAAAQQRVEWQAHHLGLHSPLGVASRVVTHGRIDRGPGEQRGGDVRQPGAAG
jgi:hypothetical protein